MLFLCSTIGENIMHKLFLIIFALSAMPLPPLQQNNNNKLIWADFENASNDKQPISTRGGNVTLFSYQQDSTLPTKLKGNSKNNAVPDFAVPSKDSPNKAIVFDYELLAPNQYAGAGVAIDGHPYNEEGKITPSDVSGFKHLSLQLFVTGTTSVNVEFSSKGHGIELDSGYPQMSFKIKPGFNTYQVSLKSINQPGWAKTKVDTKAVLKNLTNIRIAVTCNDCVYTKGTVVVDNLVFQN